MAQGYSVDYCDIDSRSFLNDDLETRESYACPA